ncbi:hypothetical protein GCM10011487_29350 [Steroidobacter agaridevorans]|uniref:Uncharacterized protein n=1 Tax=Steroidobacter agaridevorans TaxID=2695856 RepID=A0A829YCH0_9GAMM|nr:hypothetical protein GCM10011487_29350 [Steroidobacter agaridevorans]GFE89181.1 hypothetical protein GCM10011488_41350 [Steroidobacter agaridevorans]
MIALMSFIPRGSCLACAKVSLFRRVAWRGQTTLHYRGEALQCTFYAANPRPNATASLQLTSRVPVKNRS